MSFAIYLVSDERFMLVALAQAERLAEQWGCDVHVFLEDERLSSAPRVGSARVRVHLNEICATLPEGVPLSGKWPKVVYSRNHVPDLLDGYDRLLYLDVDILPLKADESLWDIEIPGGLGAVADAATLHRGPLDTGLPRDRWLDGIGVKSGRYFNSGMLLIEPRKWDAARIHAALSDYFRGRQVRAIKSQDFLNHLYDGQWTELSPRWNFQPPLFELGLESQIDPVFLHFCNRIKPWFFPGFPGASGQRAEHENAFFEMILSAGIAPKDVAEMDEYRSGRQARKAIRAFLARIGIRSGRQRAEMTSWNERSSRIGQYLLEQVNAGSFADSIPHGTSRPTPRSLRFDGQSVRFEGETISQ